MRRIIIWLKSWFHGARAVDHLAVLVRRCEIAEHAALAGRERLDTLIGEMETLYTAGRKEMESAADTQRKYEEAIASLRAELRVATDIVIPSLTASHKLILQRYDAETAIQVRRQVASMTPSE